MFSVVTDTSPETGVNVVSPVDRASGVVQLNVKSSWNFHEPSQPFLTKSVQGWSQPPLKSVSEVDVQSYHLLPLSVNMSRQRRTSLPLSMIQTQSTPLNGQRLAKEFQRIPTPVWRSVKEKPTSGGRMDSLLVLHHVLEVSCFAGASYYSCLPPTTTTIRGWGTNYYTTCENNKSENTKILYSRQNERVNRQTVKSLLIFLCL